MKKGLEKLYVVQRHVKAVSVADALRKERKSPITDVYVDPKWRDAPRDNLAEAIGFVHQPQKNEEEFE